MLKFVGHLCRQQGTLRMRNVGQVMRKDSLAMAKHGDLGPFSGSCNLKSVDILPLLGCTGFLAALTLQF